MWYRSVSRDLVPLFRSVGWDVRVTIYCDSGQERFPTAWFAGAELDGPRPGARDFVEYYSAALEYDCDYVFFVDADLFFTDAQVVASHLHFFESPDVAAISFLQRAILPGVYALLCRRELYRALGERALESTYEGLESWPDSVNRGPGEHAAVLLTTAGKKIVAAGPETWSGVADFHGTTVIRASREMFAEEIGEAQFEELIVGKRYFGMGAYDNILLGGLYRKIFGEPFAVGFDGQELGGSVTPGAWSSLRERLTDARLPEYFKRSDIAIERLALREDAA